MIRYFSFYLLILCSLYCCKEPFISIKRSSGRQISSRTTYPPERSEIAAMQIGDTINIFYKKTGWFNSGASVYVLQKYTFYSMETIWRVDSSEFQYVDRYAYPEQWFGKPLDFRLLKNNPDTLFQTIGRLEYFCGLDTIINWDGNYENCIHSFKYSPEDSILFTFLSKRELTSEKFESWRFSPPTKEQLNNLRDNIRSNSHVYFYEMLLVSKDTIKLSYSEDCTASFALVYPY